jgi:hypothetical protein
MPVPGEVDSDRSARVQPVSLRLSPHGRSQAAPTVPPPPSPGTGEGLRYKAQGEGAAASDARFSGLDRKPLYRAGAGPGNTGRLSWPSRSTAATAKK